MEIVRQYLNEWKRRRFSSAFSSAMKEHDAASEMFKKGLLTDKQYRTRARNVEKQVEKLFAENYHSTASWLSDILDVPAIRFGLESSAWVAV